MNDNEIVVDSLGEVLEEKPKKNDRNEILEELALHRYGKSMDDLTRNERRQVKKFLNKVEKKAGL